MLLRTLRLASLVSLLMIAASLAAVDEIYRLIDPGVPDGEIATYRINEAGNEWEFSETTHIAERSGIPVYQFLYVDPRERIEVTIERDTMLPIEIDSVTSGYSMTMTSSTKIEISERDNFNGIRVLSFSEIKYLLRGYPFPSEPTMEIEFLSADVEEESSFEYSIRVSYNRRETIEIEGRQFDTHRLELRMSAGGILRIMNRLVPKTYFWYSVEEPHYLVAYEGSSGFPGSPKRRIELITYSGW